ncbi:MAG: hypothetical protein N2V73_01260 [Candidatus Methanospirare jalkutatii]|nr:hypothetical protein [Candidatus Methanospirare jalkutatii]
MKSLGKVNLRVCERERGVITSEDIQEIAKIVEKLPKVKVEEEELDEIYYEGKMFD